MTEEQSWQDKQFNLADFDQEYGMLARTFQEIQRASKPATTAVQNYVASKVHDEFQARYKEYYRDFSRIKTTDPAEILRDYELKGKAQPLGYDEFFQRNKSAYLEVFNRPINLSLAAETVAPLGGKTPGQLFPSAFQATTVHEAMNWLTRSELPGILTSLARPIYGEPATEGGQAPIIYRQASNLPADEINAAWVSGFEDIHRYDITKGGNFSVWFNQSAKHGIERFRRGELDWRTGNTAMSAYENGEEDDTGGYVVDRNSGEYGDAGNTALDTASSIGNASRFIRPALRPDASVWGEYGSASGFIGGLIDKALGRDPSYGQMNVQTGRMDVSESAGPGSYGKAKVSAWLYGYDTTNFQVFGIDPNSPAAKAGMKVGAFIQSLTQILSTGFDFKTKATSSYDLADELENSGSFNLPVIQRNDETGGLIEQILHITPGDVTGRGFSETEEVKPHWMVNLADRMDASRGNNMYTLRGTWEEKNGTTVYKSLPPEKSVTASTAGILTGLYTTDEKYANGMYKDNHNTWYVSPMQVGRSDEYNVPVTITPEALRNFAPIYEEHKNEWKKYDQIYSAQWSQAYSNQLKRYTQAARDGLTIEKPFLESVRDTMLRTLPDGAPFPSTEVFNNWMSGRGFLNEVRDFEDSLAGGGTSGDFYDRTIEQWDAWASSQDRYKNPVAYGYIDPKRLAQAQQEVSGAGNYLAQQREAQWAGAAQRANPGVKGTLEYPAPEGMADGAPANGSGGVKLGKYLRPDPATGVLTKYYPSLSGTEPEMTGAIYPQPKRYTLEGLQVGVQRKRLAGTLANFTPTPQRAVSQLEQDFDLQRAARNENYSDRLFTIGDSLPFALPDSDNGTFTPGADPSLRATALFGVGDWEGTIMSGNISGHLYERATTFLDKKGNPVQGRILRALQAQAESAHVGSPAPDYQNAPVSGAYGPAYPNPIPARPQGKYKEQPGEPMGPLPTYGPDLPYYPDGQEDVLQEAAYSHLSNINANSAFPLGSMNEDDWAGSGSEPRPERENTYDGSVLGGDVNTPEMAEDRAEMGKYYLTPAANERDRIVYHSDNRTRTVDSQGGSPIYDWKTKEVIGYMGDYGEQRVNQINHQAALSKNLPEGVRKLMGPFSAELHGDQFRGVEDTNEQYLQKMRESEKRSGKKGAVDAPIAAREEYDSQHPVRDEDREMESTSDEVFQGESEYRFQQAWKVLDAPEDTLSGSISQAGNRTGFDAKITNWAAVFSNWKKRGEHENESNSTYHALATAGEQTDNLYKELTANLSSLANTGHKREAMLARLGEKDHLGNGPQLTDEMAENVRLRKPQAKYYREALQQINREYKLGLSWQPGKEEELYDQLKALRSKDPQGYAAVSSIFGSLGDQLKLSRQYLHKASGHQEEVAPEGPTPQPKRAASGDSHTNQTPGGRSMAKWSQNQLGEMRRGRGVGIDPITGAFDPMALENTPVSAQLAARGGGSRQAENYTEPQFSDLTSLQNLIAYEHFEPRPEDDQRARLVGQTSVYKTMKKRKRFDVIMPYDADSDEGGEGLQQMIRTADAAVRGAFGPGFDISDMEEVSDPKLADGFVRMGSYVQRSGQASRPQPVNENVGEHDPGEPPEMPNDIPPSDNGETFDGDGASAGGNGNGNIGGTTATASPDPTPQPSGGNRNPTPAPKPKPNTDPALFPTQPGAEGWRMEYSRFDFTAKGKNGKKGGSRQATAWARKDSEGNLGWYEMNKQGQMEPLRVNRGFGQIYDENNNLLHDVDRIKANYYQNMNAPLVSSAGNSADPAGTPAPVRDVIRTPEAWANFKPEAGMMMIDRSQGYPKFAFAVEDPENPGEMMWVNSAKDGAAQDKVRNPDWGQISDKDGNIIADVPQNQYEIWANAEGKERSAETMRIREQSRQEQAARHEELRKQREVATSTPAPSRSGFSEAFGKFNNAMWGISGRWQSKFLQAHSPHEFGEATYGENTKIAANNEYLAQISQIYNSYIDTPPTSADQILEDIVDMTGADESVARPIAEQLFGDHERIKRRGGHFKKENPMRRSIERAARLDDAYDAQDVGRGPLGFRSHVVSKVDDIGLRDIDGFKSPSLGEGEFIHYTDEKGETRWTPRIGIERTNPATGETGWQETVDANGISKGMGWAKNAFNSAMSGDLPSSPNAIVATLKERMYTELSRQMKAEVDDATKHGKNPTDAGVAAQVTKEISDHFSKQILDKVKGALGVTEGEANGSMVAEGTRYDTRIKSVDELKRKMGSDPVFAREFGGKSAEQIHAGDEMVVYDENDRSIMVGGNGKRGGSVSSDGNVASGPRVNGAMGMFGKAGALGSLMYGAYLLKREWSMAAQPTFQAAEQYATGLSEYSGLLYNGSPMGNSDAGFAYRQEAGQDYMGRAAYSSYGAYMDIPYRLAETGNLSGARLLQNTGIAAGVAVGGAMTGAMMGMSGIAGLMAAGGVVAGAAPWVAGGIAATAVGMEAYNNFLKPADAPDVTFSTPIDNYRMDAARARAATSRAKALYGGSYDEYKQIAGSRGASRVMSYDEWNLHRLDDPLQTTGNVLSDEELAPYMDAEGKVLLNDQENNKKVEALNQKVISISGDTLEDQKTLKQALGLQKHFTGDTNGDLLAQVSQAARLNGGASDDSLQSGASYASQMGYLSNTPDFVRAMYSYALETDPVKRAGMEYTANRTSQFGSQIQAVMGRGGNFVGQGARIVATYGLDTQAQVGALAGMAGGMESYGANFSLSNFDQMAGIVRDNNPFVSNVIGNAMESYMAGGGSAANALDLGSGLSSAFASAGSAMSAQDASVYQRMMGGDMRAYSYQAWQSGNMNNAFFDRAGRSITQYYGSIANQTYNHWAPTVGLSQKTAAQFLGTNNQSILNAWNAPGGNGGFYGIQRLANQQSYAASMASIGVQMKGIGLQENFYWGQNAGGSWDNPTAHSSWGIEDQQVALQDASTRAGWDDQWTRMTRSNDYAIRREDNQFQRMNTSQNYQNYQWSYAYNQFQQSQQWAQQDWQYQDTMKNLSFGWQMDDVNEAIRFASGRERKQLVKQRDRAALTHNLEDEQTDTTRDRQKELWAQQEEQYQKQREYNLELQRLDQDSFQVNKDQREEFYKLDVESFDRRKKEYEEEKKLQDELRELQRKFQYDQLQLSKEAAGAQAAAAAAQKEINDAILEGQKNWEELTGNIEQMNTYNNAYRIANATNEMMAMMDRVDTNRINKLIELIRTIGTTSTSAKWGGERD